MTSAIDIFVLPSEEAYGTECHLLYAACARAGENLLMTGSDMSSGFSDALQA